MKAIIMTAKGSVDMLQYTDMPEPEISIGTEVKVKIKAAGVNPIDTKVRRNGLFYQNRFPAVLGCDGAGEVVAIGEQVTDFKVGDEVWFCHGGLGNEQGNYAEFNVIDQRWLSLKPTNSSFIAAAAMPLVLITAWGALFDKGGLEKGQTVLIHAGAGGVGHVAIQLAKLKGAIVITTVGSDEKAEFVRSLGADHVIDYKQRDFVKAVNELTAGKGVDLTIDTVGPEIFKKSIDASSYFGRLITLLDPGEVGFSDARMKNLLIGFELMLTPLLKNLPDRRDRHVEILNQCAEWVEQGKLNVHVSEIFALSESSLAHEKIEQGHTIGKIVLEMN